MSPEAKGQAFAIVPKMKFCKLWGGTIGAISLFCLSIAATAQVTYTYNGASYTNYSYYDQFLGALTLGAPFTPTPCPITISITLATGLGPNFSGLVYPTNYSFSDCVNTINLLPNQNVTVILSTDANGKISSWHIQAVAGYYVETVFTYVPPPPPPNWGNEFFPLGFEIVTDSGCSLIAAGISPSCDVDAYYDAGYSLSATSSSVGTWTGSGLGPSPLQLSISSGNQQPNLNFTPMQLPIPLTVNVSQAMSGVQITFQITEEPQGSIASLSTGRGGSGPVSSTTVTTDQTGAASVPFYIDLPGTYQVAATCSSCSSGSPQTFTEVATSPCPSPGTTIPNVTLPPVTVRSPVSFIKPYVFSYGALSLNFVTNTPSNPSVICEAQASGTLPVYFGSNNVFNSQASVTLSVFNPGATGALQSCSFSFVGGINNQCILNGTYDSNAYYMRWVTPGFQTLFAQGNTPTIFKWVFNTGPLTYWVSLGDAGYSMTSAVTSEEPYIHQTLINNLPELPGAWYTIIQDPGNVNLAVVNSSGLTAGTLPNGQVAYDIPLSYVYQSATSPAVVLGNVQPGQYLVILSGTSSGDYDLGVATQEGVNASPQETASGYLEQGASVGYNVTISTSSGGITPSISPATIALTSGNNCDGTYTGTFKGDVTVMTGQTCILVGGGITGNVTQSGGNLVISNSTIGGNVQVNGGGTFSIGPSVVIDGNLQVRNIPVGTAQNQVCGTTTKGNLQFQNNGTAVEIGSASPSCAGNTVDGDLQVQNNTASTTIYSNIVGGNIIDQYNTAATVTDGNTVGVNLLIENNTVSTQVFNNTVTNNLQCQNDAAITGSGNTAAQKQAECSTF